MPGTLFFKNINPLQWFMRHFKVDSLPLHFILLLLSFSFKFQLDLTSFSPWNKFCSLASCLSICWSPSLKNPYFFCLADSQLSFKSSLESYLGSFSRLCSRVQITLHFHYYSIYHNLLSLPVKLSVFPSRL